MWHGLTNLQKGVLIATSLFVAIFMFVEVMLRYVFEAPLMGIEEILPLGAFWLYFIGGSFASYTRTHVKAEVIEVMVPNRRAVDIIRVVAIAITFGVCIILCVWGFNFFMWSLIERRLSCTLFIPMIYAESAVFVGIVLMTFYFLIELIERVRVVRRATTTQTGGE